MEDLDDRVGNLFLNTISKLQMVLQDYCTVSEGFGRSKCLALNDFLKNLKSLNLNSLEPCTIGDGGAQRRKKRRREPQQREDITMERNDANDSNVPKYSFPGPEKNPSDLTDNSHSVSLEQIPGLISHQPLDKDTQSIVFSATSSNECSNLQLSAHDFDNSLASASNQAELLVQSGLVDIDKFLDSIHKQQQ